MVLLILDQGSGVFDEVAFLFFEPVLSLWCFFFLKRVLFMEVVLVFEQGALVFLFGRVFFMEGVFFVVGDVF